MVLEQKKMLGDYLGKIGIDDNADKIEKIFEYLEIVYKKNKVVNLLILYILENHPYMPPIPRCLLKPY